jgi:N-acetylglucosaminyldiphosphoundecaprenol N-acetyl-beta-D-mannosaminyltransferase
MMKLLNFSLLEKVYSKEYFGKILMDDLDTSILVSFLNPYSYSVVSDLDPVLVENIDYWFIDGQSLCWILNIGKGRKQIQRASFDFSSIAVDFFIHCSNNAKSIFIIGGTMEEVEKFCSNLTNVYTNINIVGAFSGYNLESEFELIVEKVNLIQPDYIILGLGTPYQEIVGLRLKQRIVFPVALFTCGGFVTQTSISGDYYHWFFKRRLRWLQRAITSKHVRVRLVKDYPLFYIRYAITKTVMYFR